MEDRFAFQVDPAQSLAPGQAVAGREYGHAWFGEQDFAVQQGIEQGAAQQGNVGAAVEQHRGRLAPAADGDRGGRPGALAAVAGDDVAYQGRCATGLAHDGQLWSLRTG
nr:hypothetical protein [Streptomyces sasae]